MEFLPWEKFLMATVGQPMATDRDKVIAAFVGEHGRAGITEIAALLQLSKDRARSVVRGLVGRGVLEKHGNGRYTYYTLA